MHAGDGHGCQRAGALIALHHLDAPWRPADVKQREGRILRQGKTNAEVQIYRYVTEASFDVFMWQCLESKATFIGQVMTGESDPRRIEDVDGAALAYGDIHAILRPIREGFSALPAGMCLRRKSSMHRSVFPLRNGRPG